VQLGETSTRITSNPTALSAVSSNSTSGPILSHSSTVGRPQPRRVPS
jgi:hypothetical protein